MPYFWRILASSTSFVAVAIIDTLPPTRRWNLSREGNRVAVHNLRLFADARRYAVIAVMLLELKINDLVWV